LWLKFGKNLHPTKENPPKSDDTKEDRDDWIDDVVEAFCATHAFKDKYLSMPFAGNGGES
jgi:hypothetical protein